MKKNIVNIFFLFVVFMMLSASSFAAKPSADKKGKGIELVASEWRSRCGKDEKTGKESKDKCEVYQRISVKKTKARIAEMALGFPIDEKGKKSKSARGVVILPLGILLENGIVMKIDDEKPAVFKVRFCTNSGCVAYVNLDKKLLTSMKKGKNINFIFKSSVGQDVNIVMSLKGFTWALTKLD